MKNLFATAMAGMVLCGCAQQYSALGGRNFAFGKYEESSRQYEEALQSSPENETALTMAGWSYFKRGLYDKSVERFTKLQATDSKNLSAQEGLGWNYFKLGKFKESLALFQALYDKDYPGAVEGVAYNYFKLGDNENAERYLKIAIYENPRSQDNHLIRGYVAMARADYGTAVCSFSRARSLVWKPSADLDAALGNAYLSKNDKGKAARYFDCALKKDPANAAALAGKQKI